MYWDFTLVIICRTIYKMDFSKTKAHAVVYAFKHLVSVSRPHLRGVQAPFKINFCPRSVQCPPFLLCILFLLRVHKSSSFEVQIFPVL